jgi:hypothetical protein
MECKQLSHNKWIVEVQYNGEFKELLVELPQDSINQVGWDDGENTLWKEVLKEL